MSLKVFAGTEGFHEFASLVGLSATERTERLALLSHSFMPFRVTEHYACLIARQSGPYREQLLNIVLPPPGRKPFTGRFDPYGNKTYRQNQDPFLQHKYERTLLLHIDDYCVANCQFCYKVNEIRIERTAPAQSYDKKLWAARQYLAQHPEINNVLFTGGDPAAFRRTPDLIKLIRGLIESPNIRVVRFATKGLAYDPERFLDEELLAFFSEVNARTGKQVSIIAQINHPAEMDETAQTAIKALQQVGVQIRGQPAIVRGVNDSVETLIDLQQRFVDNRIVAYYLTIFMPVRGVEQYALLLDEAFRNVAESKRQLNGLEKKGTLLASHDFGKFELVGFYPTAENPEKIILKWHQAAIPEYLPAALRRHVPTRPEDILLLDYEPGCMYAIDHVFAFNGLPHFNSDGQLIEPHGSRDYVERLVSVA
ncbi:MAG: lysine 2,3-aminomutase [Chloroflexi bacterium]|nr:lysine 2,3-aminomutase [Chloroflexota bacterium]MCI0578238.1 lysine 2,3-aminomutase [Chloroflexota bacterium]MCI0649676.1 lysine 2,3-aminomutase [Chloroflexota bacterium]MCI0728836.1 lysine 2,3-aminomutase [Chloroflexota bacterium]